MEPVPSVSPLDLNTKPPTLHTALSGMPVSIFFRPSVDELPVGRYLRTPGRAFEWAHAGALALAGALSLWLAHSLWLALSLWLAVSSVRLRRRRS